MALGEKSNQFKKTLEFSIILSVNLKEVGTIFSKVKAFEKYKGKLSNFAKRVLFTNLLFRSDIVVLIECL